MGKKYKVWIIMFMATTFQTFRQFNNEVSPTAHALLSLPGIRPGFKKCCDEVAICKLECTCLPEMIVLQCLRK